jgi:hypothetical protein
MTHSGSAIVLAGPAELAEAVGYLLGYQPDPGAIVTLGLRGQAVAFGTCINIGDLRATTIAEAAADVAQRLAVNDITQAVLLAYGPRDLIDDAAAASSTALHTRDVAVVHTLRVDGGRCYCMSADACLPVGGAPIRSHGPVSAAAVYAGLSVQPDRTSLAELYAPLDGGRRLAMDEAFERADARLRALVYEDRAGDRDRPRLRADAAGVLLAHGVPAVDAAFSSATRGRDLPDDDTAWLLMLLAYLPVRDHAWKQITASDNQHRLLRGLMQRAPDDLAAPPACLLAFWALLTGHGPIANIALDRARTADPTYTLTGLLTTAMHAAIPPGTLHEVFTQALAHDDTNTN